jgi:hypothetical protein
MTICVLSLIRKRNKEVEQLVIYFYFSVFVSTILVNFIFMIVVIVATTKSRIKSKITLDINDNRGYVLNNKTIKDQTRDCYSPVDTAR